MQNVAETVIGAVVLVAAGGFLAYAAQTADVGRVGNGYMLTAAFRTADGVGSGTDVRMSGVKIGTVTGVSLDPQTFEAVTTLSLETEVQIPEDSDARILSESLLGGNYVSITPGASDFMLEDGAAILNTQGSVSLLDLMIAFGTGQGAE
ncbi:outer membrane lipid asymmetry maintenance protein MlaD [Pontivivens ytuae]|uniref:Outer membrane lipid asymmetry maintenance protein MlaD n=1 Tax=Pontivivens ytuae TaxID=2789856 RepID=A0A7S9QBU7_9RHOB|nr:outer membrane lipid asymmetry maintenance protein MlaD [Pontivivens ytuae]QPH53258.1 outer membrane lipid asymmetry maintenance protein MlaD [Pontivivens ytuae]